MSKEAQQNEDGAESAAQTKPAEASSSGSTARPKPKAAPPPEEGRIGATIRTVLGAFLLAFFIRIVLFEAFEIDGPSMEPTLLDGDRVVVSKFPFGLFLPFTDDAVVSWGMPDAGDVVILKSPADGVDIVKRVIGTPGDRIEIRDDEVFRNGESIRIRVLGPCQEDASSEENPSDCEWVEEGIAGRTWRTSHSLLAMHESMPEQTVPPGHIFVLGDHRDRSNDSRNPRVGMIPIGRVKGRAEAIYWSSGESIRWDRIFSDLD
ncbi:MAG: signal peptidase I [Sandaracinus sp.]